jgi:methionyl-tRNA formyltransferase
MSFNQIFRKAILAIPPARIINCHAGKLPFYRGRNILNWALINDEKEFGITVHYVDTGIDTGDILAQDCHPITDADDYASLLQRAHTGCADILYRTVTDIRWGRAKPRRQAEIHPVGFYCGMRGPGDERIDWSRTSREIFNLVRAVCRPAPMACTYLDAREVRINRVRMIPDAPVYRCVPGQVVGKAGERIIIKTGDTTVEALEYVCEGRIRIGDRLK